MIWPHKKEFRFRTIIFFSVIVGICSIVILNETILFSEKAKILGVSVLVLVICYGLVMPSFLFTDSWHSFVMWPFLVFIYFFSIVIVICLIAYPVILKYSVYTTAELEFLSWAIPCGISGSLGFILASYHVYKELNETHA